MNERIWPQPKDRRAPEKIANKRTDGHSCRDSPLFIMKGSLLCSLGCPGTHHVDQASLQGTEICLPLLMFLNVTLKFLNVYSSSLYTRVQNEARKHQIHSFREHSCLPGGRADMSVNVSGVGEVERNGGSEGHLNTRRCQER